MSALFDTQAKLVVRIDNDGSAPDSSSGVTIYAANDGPVAELLDRLLADPKTVKVASRRRPSGTGQRTAAHDFCSAMRLVEQECYQPA